MRTWGIEQGYPIPTFKIRDFPVRGGGRPKFWTLEQLGGIYKATKEVYEPMVGLLTSLLNTGFCKGEAIACDWDWINLKAGVVRIPANEVWEPKMENHEKSQSVTSYVRSSKVPAPTPW